MLKGKSSKAKTEKLLTEVELEMMSILWRAGEATVSDVLQALPPDRKLAYTSVSTMLRILEQKDVVGSHKAGRGHLYFPKLKKEDYEAKSVRHLVDSVFDRSPLQLVQRLLQVESLSGDEIAQIRKLLREKGN